jgi:hypothetical protein
LIVNIILDKKLYFSILDAQGDIGENSIAYSAVCKQGPGGESASKTNPLRGLGLGPLQGRDYLIAGPSYQKLLEYRVACGLELRAGPPESPNTRNPDPVEDGLVIRR